MLGSSQDLNMMAQNWRRQPSSYCYGPVVQGWTTHASLRRQAWWWRALRWWSPLSGRVTGRASEPSRTRVDDGGGYGTFRGWRLRCLVFSREKQYIGERARSVGVQGAHTIGWRGQGWAHAATWCGHPGAPLRLSFGLRVRDIKIGTSGFVSSNSENISRTIFLKYKNGRKQELALWHLVNRLVPENA